MQKYIFFALASFLVTFAARAEVDTKDLNNLLKLQTIAGQGHVTIQKDGVVVVNQYFSCSLKFQSPVLSIAGSVWVDGYWNIDLKDWKTSDKSSSYDIQNEKPEAQAFTLCEDATTLSNFLDQARISGKKLEMRRQFKCKDIQVTKIATCEF